MVPALAHAETVPAGATSAAKTAPAASPFVSFAELLAVGDAAAQRAFLVEIADRHKGTRWSGRAFFLLGRLDRAEGRRSEAIEHLSHPDVAMSFLRGYAGFELAGALLDAGRLNEIPRVVEQAKLLEQAPPLALKGNLLVARAVAAAGRFKDARAVLDQAATAVPSGPQAVPFLFEAARMCSEAGDAEGARAFYLTIVLEHPCRAGPTGCPDCDGAQWDKAEAETARSGAPIPTDKLTARALALFECRDYGRALDALTELEKRGAGLPADAVKLRIADCYIETGRKKNALDVLAKFQSKNADFKNEAAYKTAKARLALGDEKTYLRLMGALAGRGRATGRWQAEANLSLARYHEQEDRGKTAAYHYEMGALSDGSIERADEALWKAGWYKYTAREYRGAAASFHELRTLFTTSNFVAASSYWEGRAEEALGGIDRAKWFYLQLVGANPHGYYRILALERLRALGVKLPDTMDASEVPLIYRPDDEPPAPAGREWPVTIRRIEELLEAGMRDEAVAEIEGVLRREKDPRYLSRLLARIQYDQGRFRDAVMMLRKGHPAVARCGLPADDWKILYPLGHWERIRSFAGEYRLDPYLVAAVIRQESAYDVSARSGADAIGLMQIVPSTGRWLCKKLAIPACSEKDLYDPELNIRLGTYYLSQLSQDHDGDSVDMLAAYNAGASRILKWRRARPDMPEDEFIESIPFRETCWYVKNVLFFRKVYERLYPG